MPVVSVITVVDAAMIDFDRSFLLKDDIKAFSNEYIDRTRETCPCFCILNVHIVRTYVRKIFLEWAKRNYYRNS